MSDLTLDDLKTYVNGMSPQQREAHFPKGKGSEPNVIELVKSGDRVGLYCALKDNPSLLHQRDENNMTPLHHAGGDKSGLTLDILTERPNNAPWMRDKFNRLPLDVMREAGQHKNADKVERLTYPNQFKQVETDKAKLEQLRKYAEQEKSLGKTNTYPDRPKTVKQQFKAASLDKTPHRYR